MRILDHPVLGPLPQGRTVKIIVDGVEIQAREGEPILAAMMANGVRITRRTAKRMEHRGLYCGIGKCSDCLMVVNGLPNVRTCVTPVEEGMVVETQTGHGRLGE